ncbi:hypothetical protein [Flavobacterium silvaticum]|uniref:Uncharacterized protein n=1 Tax=Flavobacterium silvaticum TaxID=1852020 RepID=A0A972FKT1_9FLAO|nr:hypothetical protein [Flavobacterium silvaticum]NMH27849.1 hypothetical protein [Flavobacterium silvaticum]
MMVNCLKKPDQLNSGYNFTIGKTLEYSFADGHKDCISFKYFVASIKYMGCVVNDSQISSPLGKFYKVKYSKEDPEMAQIYLTDEISDSSEIYSSGYLRKWHRKGNQAIPSPY